METTLLKSKYILLFFLIPTLIIANTGKGKYTKKKTIKKEYNVNADALLSINNNYGNLYITTWSQNKTVIEVYIETNGNNEDKVIEKLKQITVDFEASNSHVSAKTIFNKNKSKSWWNSWSNSGKVNMKINYTIKLPRSNSVDLDNDYGSINLDILEGNARISCDYGKLDIGELRSNTNEISFDYTSNSSFGYIKAANIRADYSSFTIEKAGNIELRADYTKSKIQKVRKISYNSDYGSIYIDNAKNIDGKGDYISTRLGKIFGNVNLKGSYGSIKIAELTPEAGNVNIQTDYTSIKIGHSTNYHFNFDINLEYAGINGADDFEFEVKRVKSTDKYYKGYYGAKNTGNNVAINSEYGSVIFYKK